ncbi:MAG: hypothetical protein WDA75_26500, partial [Candidatus Latescibacterota bacterium]
LPETYESPWYRVNTRYDRDIYRRYVDAELEGRLLQDRFGQDLGRGWLLYEWSQTQDQTKGSSVWKSQQYSGLFQNLLVATDGGRRGNYRLMVGNEINTVFTPLTFAKPRFNGMRLDFAADRARGSLILSRPSKPDQDVVQYTSMPSVRTDYTNLTGGHAELQPLSQGLLGFTYLNAHHGNSRQALGEGSPFKGDLTTYQNQPLKTLYVRLRDDSPADGRGGALLFDHDVALTDTSGRVLRGRQVGLLPRVEGGIARGSALAADGSETILLTYDLTTLDHDGTQSADLRQVRVELSVANDYRIEVASDRQNDGEVRRPAPVFLTVRRAAGNVQDNSNATVEVIDYGLPTATEVIGMNWSLTGWHGLTLLGEAALSRRHRRYPTLGVTDPHPAVDQAKAGYLQASYTQTPVTLYAEGFHLDDAYSTSAWLTGSDGQVRYNNPAVSLYEFVDDDDDLNALPEWPRALQPSSDAAWPGYDENADFLNDGNQNSNLYPDYEEPFLRFRADRPEFLPGLDLNYNRVIDRFENDEFPDYPYRQDRRGYNAYAAYEPLPDLVFTLGQQRLHLLSGDGRTRADYALLRATRFLPRAGRVRLFEHLALVRDNVPDPLRQWQQISGLAGQMRDLADPLAARDTWVQSAYLDLEHRLGPDIRLLHRWRWDLWWQRDDREELRQRTARRASGFFGLIDKVEWSLPVGLAVLEPRWKSEYRRERPYVQTDPATESLEETFFLLWTQPVMAERVGVAYFPRYGRGIYSSELQAGLELSWYRQLAGEGERGAAEVDHASWNALCQLVNRNAYQGYTVVARIGLEVGRLHYPDRPTERRSLFFLTVHAGLK